MTIESIPIKSLELLERNPRKISKEQFSKLCKSLEDDPDFFQKRPVLVNKTDGKMVVYAGNQRVRAAKQLGWKQVPCIIDEEVPEQIVKHRIAKDNLHNGGWDWDILGSDYDLDLLADCGFSEDELDFANSSSIEEPTEKKKKKKQMICPNCLHEFET